MLSLTYKNYLEELKEYIGVDCTSICKQYLEYDTNSKICVDCECKLFSLDTVPEEAWCMYTKYDIVCNRDSWICTGCGSVYVECNTCRKFCKFLGHDGWYREKDQDRHIIKYSANRLMTHNEHKYHTYFKVNKVLIDYLCPYITGQNKKETINCIYFIAYYMGYKNLICCKIDNKDNYCITGPDGGENHYWKCVNKECLEGYNVVFRESDK